MQWLLKSNSTSLVSPLPQRPTTLPWIRIGKPFPQAPSQSWRNLNTSNRFNGNSNLGGINTLLGVLPGSTASTRAPLSTNAFTGALIKPTSSTQIISVPSTSTTISSRSFFKGFPPRNKKSRKKGRKKRWNKLLLLAASKTWTRHLMAQVTRVVEKDVHKNINEIVHASSPDEALKAIDKAPNQLEIADEDQELTPFLTPLQIERLRRIRFPRKFYRRRSLRPRLKRIMRRMYAAKAWYYRSRYTTARFTAVSQQKIEDAFREAYPNWYETPEAKEQMALHEEDMKQYAAKQERPHLLFRLGWFFRNAATEKRTLHRYLLRNTVYSQPLDWYPEKEEEYSAIRRFWRQFRRMGKQYRRRTSDLEGMPRHESKYYVDDEDERPPFYQSSLFPISPILKKLSDYVRRGKAKQETPATDEDEEPVFDKQAILAKRRKYRPGRAVVEVKSYWADLINDIDTWKAVYTPKTRISDILKEKEKQKLQEQQAPQEGTPQPEAAAAPPPPASPYPAFPSFPTLPWNRPSLDELIATRDAVLDERREKRTRKKKKASKYIEEDLGMERVRARKRMVNKLNLIVPEINRPLFAAADVDQLMYPTNPLVESRLEAQDTLADLEDKEIFRGQMLMKRNISEVEDDDHARELISIIRSRAIISSGEYIPPSEYRQFQEKGLTSVNKKMLHEEDDDIEENEVDEDDGYAEPEPAEEEAIGLEHKLGLYQGKYSPEEFLDTVDARFVDNPEETYKLARRKFWKRLETFSFPESENVGNHLGNLRPPLYPEMIEAALQDNILMMTPLEHKLEAGEPVTDEEVAKDHPSLSVDTSKNWATHTEEISWKGSDEDDNPHLSGERLEHHPIFKNLLRYYYEREYNITPMDPKAAKHSLPLFAYRRKRHKKHLIRKFFPQLFSALHRRDMPVLREYLTPEYFQHISKQLEKNARSPRAVKYISRIKPVKVKKVRVTPRYVILKVRFIAFERWRIYSTDRTQFRDATRKAIWRARVAMDFRGTYVLHNLKLKKRMLRMNRRRRSLNM